MSPSRIVNRSPNEPDTHNPDYPIPAEPAGASMSDHLANNEDVTGNVTPAENDKTPLQMLEYIQEMLDSWRQLIDEPVFIDISTAIDYCERLKALAWVDVGRREMAQTDYADRYERLADSGVAGVPHDNEGAE